MGTLLFSGRQHLRLDPNLLNEDMDTQDLLTKTPHMGYLVISVILLVTSGLYVWWHATSTPFVTPKKDEAAQQDVETYLIYQDIDGHAARTKQARKGRCLLSLDGGGIRALSQIVILYEISNRIKYDLGLEELPRLCNYFDLVSGVGTGGLLAILIGRLGLTVQQAEEEYLKIMDYISSAVFDTIDLDGRLKVIIKKYTGDSEALMYDPKNPTSHCKVFVGACAVSNISRLVKFRSFDPRKGQEPNLPIWQVARAALIGTGQLLSIQLGPKLAPVTYVSGELGWNNPSKEVIKEFEAEWRKESILCFISIGTGHQGVVRVDASNTFNTLNSMATDCQRIAEEIAHRFQGQNNYFRLSVERDLQETDGRTPLILEDVIIHTKAYLDSTWATTSIDLLVGSLLRADTVFPWQTTKERFEETMKKYLHDIRSLLDGIEINAIKEEVQAALLMLELIQQVDSDEEGWLKLAKAVCDYTSTVAKAVIPKVWEPYLEHPLWPSINNYFIELRKMHMNAEALLAFHSDLVLGSSTDQGLLSKWGMDLEKCLKAIQTALSGEAYGQVALLRKRQQEKEREELLSWLSPLRPERRHEDVKGKRTAGTGMWFLNHPIFVAWCAFESIRNYCALLSFGAPGAGKTMMFSAVIEYLRKARIGANVVTILLYCDYRDQVNQTFVNLVGSLARQLALQVPSIPTPVKELYEPMKKEQTPLNIEALRTIVNELVKPFDCVYICIDALDECQSDSRTQLLEFLKTLSGTTLRVFVTGRPNIEAELAAFLANISISRIPIAANREDLRLYLSQRFSQDRYPEAMDEALQAQITDKIIEWSQGIFLLSMLQIATVLEQDTKRDRREMLSRIPIELSETYTATLERISQQAKARSERALRIMTWVHNAERPLRVIELQCALAVKEGDTAFDKDGMPSETALVDCCLGLVVIEQETGTIRFTHFTLQEYFDKHQDILVPSGHTMIAKTCLTYLAFDHVSNLYDIKRSSPFIEYIGSNTGHHLRKGSDATTDKMIMDVLSTKNKFSILKIFLNGLLSRFPFHGPRPGPGPSPLHWVAFFGVHSIVESILQAPGDFNAREKYLDMTPLACAARNGHEAVVKLLVNTPGIDLNLASRYGQTPLSLAATRGQGGVVKLLVYTLGVDLNPKDKSGRTPLGCAAANGYDIVVKHLLNTPGVDLNTEDGFSQTPLSLAAENGHSAVVKLLVNASGVNLNQKDKFDRTSLALAAAHGRDTVVELLLNTPGVNFDPQDRFGRTPLSLAAGNGYDAVVKLLVNFPRVAFNPKDVGERTPLHWAAKNGCSAVVKLLLDTLGVELNPTDTLGQTPLSLAAENGHTVVVKLLVNTLGVHLNARNMDNRTPLSLAAENGHHAAVKLLLDTPGVDLNPKDKDNRTPLSLAAENGRGTVVKLLLNTPGVDLNPMIRYSRSQPLKPRASHLRRLSDSEELENRTPLTLAAAKGHDAVVEMLVNTPGVDLNPKDKDNRTPLSLAAASGHDTVVKVLLRTPGVDLNPKDRLHQTPLSLAGTNGHDAVFKLLANTPGVELKSTTQPPQPHASSRRRRRLSDP